MTDYIHLTIIVECYDEHNWAFDVTLKHYYNGGDQETEPISEIEVTHIIPRKKNTPSEVIDFVRENVSQYDYLKTGETKYLEYQ